MSYGNQTQLNSPGSTLGRGPLGNLTKGNDEVSFEVVLWPRQAHLALTAILSPGWLFGFSLRAAPSGDFIANKNNSFLAQTITLPVALPEINPSNTNRQSPAKSPQALQTNIFTAPLTPVKVDRLNRLRLFCYCQFVIRQDHGFDSLREPNQLPG